MLGKIGNDINFGLGVVNCSNCIGATTGGLPLRDWITHSDALYQLKTVNILEKLSDCVPVPSPDKEHRRQPQLKWLGEYADWGQCWQHPN